MTDDTTATDRAEFQEYTARRASEHQDHLDAHAKTIGRPRKSPAMEVRVSKSNRRGLQIVCLDQGIGTMRDAVDWLIEDYVPRRDGKSAA